MYYPKKLNKAAQTESLCSLDRRVVDCVRRYTK